MTQQCYVVDGHGLDTLHLEERDRIQEPKHNEVLVDVRAVSLNYRDLLVATGKYGKPTPNPFIACSDMAGEVAKVGSSVSEFQEGDRVINSFCRFWPAGMIRPQWVRAIGGGTGVDGVLTKQVCYPEESLVSLPSHMSFQEGSTLPVAGLTAWACIVTHGKTRPGEWVLAHGTGGVSIFAVQIAKMLGARVAVSTSSEEKASFIKEKLSVDFTFDYRDEHWPKKLREVTGGGADIIVEVAGGETFSRSIKACNYGARIGVIGNLQGLESQINLFDLIPKQITVRGIFTESTAELRSFCQALQATQLHPFIDRSFPFDQARKAYDYLQSQKHIGKVIIDITSQKT